MSTFHIQFNQGLQGGSLVIMTGEDSFPIYVPANRQGTDWDLTETFYPDLAKIMVDLEREEEVFTKIHIFPNKLNGRSMVIHHASTQCRAGGRFVQTLQIEEVHGAEKKRLKYSYTFYVTKAFVKEYREAMKKLHAFLISDMRTEAPRATLALYNPLHELVREIQVSRKPIPQTSSTSEVKEIFFTPGTFQERLMGMIQQNRQSQSQSPFPTSGLRFSDEDEDDDDSALRGMVGEFEEVDGCDEESLEFDPDDFGFEEVGEEDDFSV